MDKRWLFSYTLLVSSFLSFPLAAECVSTPDCADLGYDKTSCPSGDSVLKCPFDTSKLKCIPQTCEAIGKKTCENLCVSTEGCCSDNDCAARQACDNYVCKDVCAVGDIYYSDKTCSTDLIADKTPIGVVGHITNGGKNGVVIALEDTPSKMQWGCYGTNASLTYYDSQLYAKTDFAGKANTQTILNKCSERPIAASYCNEYSKGGVSGWYLPAYGELYAIMYTNFSIVNTGLGKISSGNQISSGYWYWSSSGANNSSAACVKSDSSSWNDLQKSSKYNVRCIFGY